MLNSHTPFERHRAGARQRGVSLLFALITLVALLLSTLALVRTVDTGALVLGNIGFKQDATAAADQATREAIDWLTANAASLNLDVSASGYYASNQQYDYVAGELNDSSKDDILLGPLDVTGNQAASSSTRQLVNWDGDSCASASSGSFAKCTLTPASTAAKINGNEAKFIIFRLCSKPGDFTINPTVVCSRPLSGTSGKATKRGELNYVDNARLTGTSSPFFRIVVRVKGARNTTSFTETIVHF
ncbi:pilus assembly protein PilX [Variovorax dokdonensis]|uniref:Pilus assembly protein PilX n=1 Tax=Variovorax dokdonensis TaxID=344883 RepID=A0ABT7N9U3_9BURK|nr:pilus assembly protein PilX [Variovorax dokdonensis]MDM0044630.1 pilus assembly protein PilX [Variovorax dokdonensis]